MLRKLIAAALLCFAGMIGQVHAQGSPVLLPGGCGTGKSATDSLAYLTVDSTLKLCVNATVSASITGFPTIQSTGTPIAVTTGGVTGALPTGVVVVASNVGATNGAYCKLGASASTSDQLIPPNSWFAFTVGASTQLTCITSTSTTTVNMVGGSGLPTGSGGGGGSGGGATNITQVGGTNVPTGGGLQSGALPVDASTSSQIHADLTGPVTACAAAPCLTTIGNVGFDPSSGVSAPAQAFLALPATTTTQIIPLSGVKVTYVTLSKVWSGGTVNVTFKYGTGANCGTGTTTLEGPYPMTAQAGWVEGNGAGPAMIVPSAQALCVTTDASVGGGVKLIYQQK